MRLIYIAGPFRAPSAWQVELNIRDAEALGHRVMANSNGELGAVIPHTMYRFFDKSLPDSVFLEASLELMRRCDGVLLARDWVGSAGTRAEVAEAERLGIPVFGDLKCLLGYE